MAGDSKVKRHQKKCSECRIQRKKLRIAYFTSDQAESLDQCTPPERNWDEKEEKCEYCLRRGFTCGPNLRKREDAAANPSASSSSTLPSSSQPSHEDSDVQDGHDMGTASHKRKRRGKPSMDREERFSEVFDKIRLKCKKLNSVGRGYVLASGVGLHCGNPCIWKFDEHRDIANKLREEYHTLFVKIVNTILDIGKQGNQEMAISLMWKLWLTLQRYRELCDSQKRGALSDMAEFFEKNGEEDEHQNVLGMIADIDDPYAPDPKPDPCDLLATSFLKDDEGIPRKVWQKHFAKSSMPSNLALKPLQRAAQHGNPKIADFILSRQSGYDQGPAIFNLEALHIAASYGHVETLSTLIKSAEGRNVDARTVQDQTPLFLAAANGQEGCCRLLLEHKADYTLRDKHGHTILEVAARTGNLNVVRMLVRAGAELGAPVDYRCASTPMQAAIESGSQELVQYLLDRGVDIHAQRAYDHETAMSLAQARDMPLIVSRLQEIEVREGARQFMMPDSDFDDLGIWRSER